MIKSISVIFTLLILLACVQKQIGGESMQIPGKKILMIVAPEDFKDEEYFIPKEIFEANKAVVITASLSTNPRSVNNKIISADIILSEVNSEDYDAVVFVGGPGASIYFDNEHAHKIAREFYEKNKLVTAICIAPSTLANAGILSGKKATAFPSEKNNLELKGVEYTGESVTRDKNIITGRDPTVAREFAEEIVKALTEVN